MIISLQHLAVDDPSEVARTWFFYGSMEPHSYCLLGLVQCRLIQGSYRWIISAVFLKTIPALKLDFFSETSLLCGSLNRTTLIVIAILVHHALFFATSNHPVMSGWLQHVTAILEIKCKYWVHSTTLRLLQGNLGNGFEDRICNYGIWFNTSGVPGKNAVVLQLQEHDRPILNDDMGLWHF